MTAGKKTQRDAGSINTERIGKVFIVVGQDVRRCLVCEQLFTRRAASEHAKVACHWVLRSKAGLYIVNENKEETMSLDKKYVRDGSRKIIGSVTTGFDDTSSVVRDEHNQIAGRTNDRFQTTRDAHGKLVSINSPDPGLLIGRKK